MKPKKPGRPRMKRRTDVRTQTLIFRLTRREEELVRAVASSKGVSLSRFMRDAVLRATGLD